MVFDGEVLVPFIDSKYLKKHYKNFKPKDGDAATTRILKALAYLGRVAEEILKGRLELRTDILILITSSLNTIALFLNMISSKAAYDAYNQIVETLTSNSDLQKINDFVKKFIDEIERGGGYTQI